MTAITTIEAPRVPPAASYGPIVNDIEGMAQVDGLVGGAGRCRWKQLINGMHLPGGGWGCVEYVAISPGAACGTHLHAAQEEIYHITSGTAVVSVNGHDVPVRAGDLITCPLGTLHGIAVPGTASDEMAFLVVEAAPGTRPALDAPAPARIEMPARLRDCAGYRGGGEFQDTCVAQVDLRQYLNGPWLGFSLIVIPPQDTLGPSVIRRNASEVLFVTSGDAEISTGTVTVSGTTGLCVGSGLAATTTIRNPSADQELRLVSIEMEA